VTTNQKDENEAFLAKITKTKCYGEEPTLLNQKIVECCSNDATGERVQRKVHSKTSGLSKSKLQLLGWLNH
jgi:hypothetical protein